MKNYRLATVEVRAVGESIAAYLVRADVPFEYERVGHGHEFTAAAPYRADLEAAYRSATERVAAPQLVEVD